MGQANSGVALPMLVSLDRLVGDLRGLTPSFSSLQGPNFDRVFERELGRVRFPLELLVYLMCRSWLLVLSGNYEEAATVALQMTEAAPRTPGMPEQTEGTFWAAVPLVAHYDEATPELRSSYLSALLAIEDQYRVWQKHNPKNFSSSYALISAEIARIQGHEPDAMRLYEEAIRKARENGFVQREAVAYEFAARYYRARGFTDFADTYLRKTRACYARWGADGKVRQLDSAHPEIRIEAPPPPASIAERLDALAITNACCAFSSEIVLDQLLRTLMRVVIQSAGAQRGYLLLARDGELLVAVEALEHEQVNVHGDRGPALANSGVPLSVLNYVRHTREKVVLQDVSAPNDFSLDDYFLAGKTGSALCFPVLKQAELIAVLYLENNLVTGVFTPERLAVVELLASQAAVSLQNALFYADLRKSRELLQNIIDTSTAVVYVKDC